MRSIALVALVALSASGCTTMGPIPSQESMVVFDLPTSFAADRNRRWDGRDLVEDWTWDQGQLFVIYIERTQYLTTGFKDPRELIEEVQSWPTMERGGTEFSVRDVKTSDNSIGQFMYALSSVDSRGDRCAILLQGLPASAGAGFEPIATATSSQGYISLYECWSASDMSESQLEERILSLGEAMKFIRR